MYTLLGEDASARARPIRSVSTSTRPLASNDAYVSGSFWSAVLGAIVGSGAVGAFVAAVSAGRLTRASSLLRQREELYVDLLATAYDDIIEARASLNPAYQLPSGPAAQTPDGRLRQARLNLLASKPFLEKWGECRDLTLSLVSGAVLNPFLPVATNQKQVVFNRQRTYEQAVQSFTDLAGIARDEMDPFKSWLRKRLAR